jgi:predicted glutamine amidotransferase
VCGPLHEYRALLICQNRWFFVRNGLFGRYRNVVDVEAESSGRMVILDWRCYFEEALRSLFRVPRNNIPRLLDKGSFFYGIVVNSPVANLKKILREHVFDAKSEADATKPMDGVSLNGGKLIALA